MRPHGLLRRGTTQSGSRETRVREVVEVNDERERTFLNLRPIIDIDQYKLRKDATEKLKVFVQIRKRRSIDAMGRRN